MSSLCDKYPQEKVARYGQSSRIWQSAFQDVLRSKAVVTIDYSTKPVTVVVVVEFRLHHWQKIYLYLVWDAST